MIILGVDAHKTVHVAVAVDEGGRPLDTWQGPNCESAWQEMLVWAGQWGSHQWGIEGTGNYGQGLAQHLVAAGDTVYKQGSPYPRPPTGVNDERFDIGNLHAGLLQYDLLGFEKWVHATTACWGAQGLFGLERVAGGG